MNGESSTARGPRDKAFRLIFAGMLIFGLVTGYVMRPAMNGSMRTFLADSSVDTVERVEPAFQPPMMHWGGRVLSVVHTTNVEGRPTPLTMRSYFTPDGDHLGTHTVSLPVVGRRAPGAIEAEMTSLGEAYLSPSTETSMDVSINEVLEAMSERVAMSRLRGLVLFPARWVRGSEAAEPENHDTYILNLWCAPGDGPAADGRVCPRAARIIFDVNSHSVLRIDQLL